jgi:hypothetical protein
MASRHISKLSKKQISVALLFLLVKLIYVLLLSYQ